MNPLRVLLCIKSYVGSSYRSYTLRSHAILDTIYNLYIANTDTAGLSGQYQAAYKTDIEA